MNKTTTSYLLLAALALFIFIFAAPKPVSAGCVIQVGGQYLSDWDCDSIPDRIDNCIYDYNPLQEDSDNDGTGDACEPLTALEAHANPTEGTEPLDVALTCTVEGGRAPYLYRFDYENNGAIDFSRSSDSTTFTKTHTYSRGIWQAQCIVQDENGDELSALTEEIQVSAPVQPLTVHVQADRTTGYVPLPVSFYCSAEGGVSPYDYTWQFGDGQQANSQNIIHRYTEPGEYTAACTATDSGNREASDSILIHVSQPLNQPPVLQGIPDQTIMSGEQFQIFDLDNYASDPDNAAAELRYSFSGNNQLQVRIDEYNKVYLSYPFGFTGSETITFKVTDRRGLSDTDSAVFRVNPMLNQPPVFSNIPDQTVDCGENFVLVDLRQYVADPDDAFSSLGFSYSGNHRIDVFISNGVVHFANPGENVIEIITIKATDPHSLFDTDAVRLKVENCAVDQPPVLSGIPDQTIDAGDSFQDFDLDQYASDPDNTDAELTFNYAGNNRISVSINQATHVVHLTYPAGFTGGETITFKATDPAGVSDSDTAVFTIRAVHQNEPPVLQGIPDQTIASGEQFQIFDLDDYASDPDNSDAELHYSFSGNNQMQVHIDEYNKVSLSYPIGYIGSETITFKATDPDGLYDTDSVVFKITALPPTDQPPVFSDVPDQTVNCGEDFVVVDLRQYVTDSDDTFSSLVFSYSGNQRIDVFISNGIVHFANPGENVIEVIIVKATDPHGLFDTDSVRLKVQNCGVNQGPVLSGIPDQTVVQGNSFDQFDLDNYAADPDNTDAELTFDYSGNNRISVHINPTTHIVTLDYPDDFTGQETITFKATDPSGLSDTDSAVFKVTAGTSENRPPRFIEEVSDEAIACDEEFAPIYLKDMVEDPDNAVAELIFSATGNDLIDVDISNGIAYLSNPEEETTEEITFKVTDPDGLSGTSAALFRVKNCEEEDENEPPRISGIPDQTIYEGEEFEVFDLDDYASDPDDSESSLDYSVSGDDDLRVRIDSWNRVYITFSSRFSGSETLTFKVTDPHGESDTDSAVFRVRTGYYDREDIIFDEYDYYYYPPYPDQVYELNPAPEAHTLCTLYDTLTHKTVPDFDCDDIPDREDNCPTVANENQRDLNMNKIGDACDLQLTAFTINPQELDSGNAFTLYANVRNAMDERLDKIKLRVTIDELGITQEQAIETLEAGESYESSFTIQVPDCTKAKKYIVKLNVEYGTHDTVYKSG
ncbi:MAG: PKD domain-containing protein, partial [Nanoarchaeota archaeon]